MSDSGIKHKGKSCEWTTLGYYGYVSKNNIASERCVLCEKVRYFKYPGKPQEPHTHEDKDL